MDKKKTGLLIKEARIRKNYTQTELGNLIAVSNKAVSRWENGESFPDIGVLELLAQTLNLPIQDIIMGEKSKEEDQAVLETVRIAKIQTGEKRRRIIESVIGMMAILYVCILGTCSLTSYGTIDMNWTVVYSVSYFLFIVFIFGDVLIKKKRFEMKLCDKSSVQIIVPIITYIIEVLICSIFFSCFKKEKMPFYMEAYDVGPLLNVILIIIFGINLLFFIYSIREMVRNVDVVNGGILISVASLLLSGVNGELLHNLDTFEKAWLNLWSNISIISVEMIVAFILVSLYRKIK